MKKIIIISIFFFFTIKGNEYSVTETSQLLSQLESTLIDLLSDHTPESQIIQTKLAQCVELSQKIRLGLPSEEIIYQTKQKDQELSSLCKEIKQKEYSKKRANKIGIWISGGAVATFATLYLTLKNNLEQNSNLISKSFSTPSWINGEVILKGGIVCAAIFFISTIWNKISDYFFNNKDTQNHLAKAEVYSELYKEKLLTLENQVEAMKTINTKTAQKIEFANRLIQNTIIPQIAALLDIKAESAKQKMNKSGNKGKQAREKFGTCKLQLENLIGELPITQARQLRLKTIKLASTPQDNPQDSLAAGPSSTSK